MLPYNSPDFPEIPRQDYSNLPIQQLGLHNIEFMRIGKGCNGGDSEGLISNYQRTLDGFLAGLDKELLVKAQNLTNSGFDSTILDIGFGDPGKFGTESANCTRSMMKLAEEAAA